MSDRLLPPNEETTGIDTYTKWVWRKWLVILSSGGIAFVLLIWGLVGFTITSLPILISIYSLFFIIQVYVATHQLWEAERKDKLSIIETVRNKDSQIEKILFEKDSLEQETRQLQLVLLQREQDRKPNLLGSVRDIRIYSVVDEAGINILGTRISLYLGISNASTVPTTISGFILSVVSKNATHIGYSGNNPSKFGIPNVAQQNCLVSQIELNDSNQRLADRFINRQKSELGERHEGWLFFDFYTIMDNNDDFDWGNNLELKVIDAFEEKHQINGGLLKRYDKVD